MIKLNYQTLNNTTKIFVVAEVGNNHEGTVDGVHFTDLGFSRNAEYLINYFKKLELIDK